MRPDLALPVDSAGREGYHFLAATMHHVTNSNPWILLFLVALALAIVIWAILSARKRTQELTRLAPQIGLTFMGKAWHGPFLDPLHKTSLLQRTRGGFSNVMVGSAGNLQTIVFDYTYRAGKSTSSQTLACFSHDQQIPPFVLKPENLFDRLGDAFVHNDIDFDSNPVFSERYALKSPEEQATRRLFTPSLLASMERLPADKGWTIEGNGANLFIYRHGRTVPAANLQTFLQETSTIASTIFSSDGLKNSLT
jgi:hypothetical protein